MSLHLTMQNISVIVDSTVFGSVALYSCDKDYELMGDANRTCGENELWSGEQPICISMLISYHIHLLHYLHNHISTKSRKGNTNDVLCIHVIKTVYTYNYGFVYFANLSVICDAHNYIMDLHNRRLAKYTNPYVHHKLIIFPLFVIHMWICIFC